MEDVGFICDFGLGLEVNFTVDFGGLDADDDLGGVAIEGLRDLALAAILDDALVGGVV